MLDSSAPHGTTANSLAHAFRRQVVRNRTKVAVVEYDASGTRRSITYQVLDNLSDRVARYLVSQEVGSGEVVAAMSSNRLEAIVAYYGCLKAGATFTGINPAFTDRDLDYMIGHAAPSVVFADQKNAGRAASTDGVNVVDFDDATLFRMETVPDEEDPFEIVATENDAAMIVYTSGTESRPKGVVVHHRNFLIATTPYWLVDDSVNSSDVFLLLAPFYTMAGIGTVTNLMSIGATVVVIERVKADVALNVIERERVTNLSQTPTFFAQMAAAESLATTDLRSLRHCHTYGGPIPKTVVERFSEHAPHIVWATYWGQSELSQLGAVGLFKSLEDIPGGDLRWIGKPMSAVEVKVIDEEGEPAEVGELLCRGPAVMSGYYKDEDQTAATIVDGWLKTGDIVGIDEDSNIFFFDRKKDVIKTGGMNVSSLEVENVLKSHPDVQDAAVVGISDEYWAEAVTAFVVPVSPDVFDREGVLDMCRKEMTAYKVPKSIVVLDELPTDGQGKVVKRKLREGWKAQPA